MKTSLQSGSQRGALLPELSAGEEAGEVLSLKLWQGLFMSSEGQRCKAPHCVCLNSCEQSRVFCVKAWNVSNFQKPNSVGLE